MQTFKFTLKTRTRNGLEFTIGSKEITAKNYDEANKIFSNLDKPFHHFATVESIKN